MTTTTTNTTFVFPLFHTLYQDTEDAPPLSEDDQLKLIEDMKLLDVEGNELVYAIIRNFSLEKDKGLFTKLPYQSKKIKKGLRFDMSQFPNRLQSMLRVFVDLHMKKIREEEELKKVMESTKNQVFQLSSS